MSLESLKYPYKLPALGYAYNALEPYIDAQTMELHYTKHHQAYVNNLNKALENYPDLQKLTLTELLTQLDKIPQEIRKTVRDNGGGHLNHSFFWTLLKKPDSSNSENKPNALILDLINRSFGSFDQFKEKFNSAAKSVFGSGWAWLSLENSSDNSNNNSGKLVITSTPNQDAPITQGLKPILGLDVWEHAYYLKYQNRRPDYIEAWWHVINWPQVEEYYNKA